MAIDIGLNLYRSPLIDKMQSGYDPNATVYSHGDPFSFTHSSLGTNSIIEKRFLGGSGGTIESLANNATTANSATWDFYYSGAGVPYRGNTDASRGKVIKNDYGVIDASPQIDAIISMTAAADIPENTIVYWHQYTRAAVRDSGGALLPDNAPLQWKVSRGIQSVKTITDSANVRNEQFTALQFQGSGLQTRLENAAGVASGTVTSATTTSVIATGAAMVPNVWVGFLATVTKTSDNSKQYVKVASNTATTLVFEQTITTPSAGDTFQVGGSDAAQFTYGGTMPVLSQGWIQCQGTVYTGSQGGADGYFRHSVRQGSTRAVATTSGVSVYGSATRSRYIPLNQGYFGNGTPSVASVEMWNDDVFVQIGSDRRLVLADSLDMTTAHQEIQDWATWSGNTVVGAINTGGITTSGEYYLCAVSGDTTVDWYTAIQVEV